MDAIANRLDSIDGLRVFAYPPDSVVPPAAIVTYPDDITYDATYARGMDRMTVPVVVAVGRVTDRSTRDRLGAYVDSAGAQSIKAVIESGTYSAFDTVRVMSAEFDVYTIAGTDYMAAIFDLDIAGTGV
jgi:hypothetical protein